MDTDTGGDLSDASCDDGLCSNEDCFSAYNGYSSDDGDDVIASIRNDDDELIALADGKRYVALTEHEIGQRLSNEAAAMAEALSVPADWALALLCHYRWNPLCLQDEWFAEEHRVRDAVGLGDAAVGFVFLTGGDEVTTCAICTEAKPGEDMASAGCAHYYCHGCWCGYVAAALDDGGAGRCLALRCPDASCSRAVLRGMVERFATGATGRDAYARALARAYVAARGPWFKPCTAAGCGGAVEVLRDGGASGGGGDVVCRCGNAFCYRCGGAAHWPASCGEAARWGRAADAASVDWVLLNTKPCPRCRRPIERVEGCRHMVCAPPCGHAFCWVCLAPAAAGGGDGCGGSHGCTDREQVEASSAERARARGRLGQFLHYQDLWMASLRQRRDAEVGLRRHREAAARAGVHPRDVEWVAAAWEQVAEGRRVVGNACAHGRRLREEEEAAAADTPARWELFELWRRGANAVLERLQQRAEAAAAAGWRNMEEHRDDLWALTSTTRLCLENFTKAVAEGRPETET